MRYSDTGRLLAGVNKPVFASEKKIKANWQGLHEGRFLS